MCDAVGHTPHETGSLNPYPSVSDVQPRNSCGYIRLEATTDNDLFITNNQSPNESSGVRIFISVYAIFMAAIFILTYFFCLHYWHIPYCLGCLIGCQILLQFILLFYSDFFCQLAYILSWRCPGAATSHSCFCSVCDWILIFSYLVSYTAALSILAPLIPTFHQISVFPPIHNSLVSTLSLARLDSVSFIHFHPSVTPQEKIINAMLIPTKGFSPPFSPTAALKNETYSALEFSPAQQKFIIPFNSSNDNSTPLKATPLMRFAVYPITILTRSLLKHTHNNSNTPHQQSTSTILDQTPIKTPPLSVKERKYSHAYSYRLWPNIGIGQIPNATVAVALLQDRVPQSDRTNISETLRQSAYVWSVCSDAATIACECSGLEANRVIHPPLCKKQELCGFQMPYSMASKNHVVSLVQQTKKKFNLSTSVPDIFICMEKPEILQESIAQDFIWGWIVSLPFLLVFTVVSIRLLIFYIFQAPF